MDVKSRILTALKAKLEGKEFLSEPSNNRQYYLKDWRDNLFDKGLGVHELEFLQGQGHELSLNGTPDIASVGSSAALAVNLFGINDACQLKDAPDGWGIKPGSYLLSYEYKEDTETVNGHRANIDVCLHNGNDYMFIEMKMLEPLEKASTKPSEAYTRKDNYANEQAYHVFNELFEKAKIVENFDRCQMTKHLLGIYNKFAKEKTVELRHVVLLNCYWKPSVDFCEQRLPYQRADLSLLYTSYQTEATDFASDVSLSGVIDLFKSVNVVIHTDCFTTKTLLKYLNLSDERKDYLTRYEV